ncbi:MAG: OmpH family outer membrane protein, partial [Mucinivorans sp.]
MNKLFTISLVALAIVLTSCGTKGSKSVAMSDSLATKGVAYSGKIAFVRMDSLMQGYGMYIDMRDAFTKKQSQMQSELENKGRALEREVGDYQQKAQKGLVTRYQAQTI